jgi:hypothetical protein
LRLAMSRTMSSSSRTPSSRFMTSRIRPQGRLNSTHYTKYVSIGSSEISSSLEARSFHKMPTDVSTSLHSNDTVLGLLKSMFKLYCTRKVLEKMSQMSFKCLPDFYHFACRPLEVVKNIQTFTITRKSLKDLTYTRQF